MLTAFILDVERFEDPGKLVAYFGVLPIEVSSGVDRDGKPRGPKRYVMSKRGNDLVRRYLWMAALSAIRCNPAVRALYLRVVAKHPKRKAIAIGHAMRKLLHLVFALWKSEQPFDPNHHVQADGEAHAEGRPGSDMSVGQSGRGGDGPTRSRPRATSRQWSRRCQWSPRPVPTTVAESGTSVGGGRFIDFAHLKSQSPMARVLRPAWGCPRRLQRAAKPKAVRLPDPPR